MKKFDYSCNPDDEVVGGLKRIVKISYKFLAEVAIKIFKDKLKKNQKKKQF